MALTSPILGTLCAKLSLGVIVKIEEYKNNKKSFHLKLPDGWFGRPYDNWHKLTEFIQRPNKTILEIDEQLYLIFTGEIKEQDHGDKIVISNFIKLVFDWQGYGDMNPNCKIYREGFVEMINV